MNTDQRIHGRRLLAEGLVVVASILVAFGLDAWWDGRAQARTEAEHLRALRFDFEQNADRLRSLIERETRIADASRDLLRAAVSGEAVSDDEVGARLGEIFSSVRFDPVMGAYEAVVASGGLAQIRDDRLRFALAEFASFIEGRYYERFSNEVYFEFVRSFTGRLGLSAAVLRTDSGFVDRPPGRSYTALLEDPKFHEHLALRYAGETGVAESYAGLLEIAERILVLLERAGS